MFILLKKLKEVAENGFEAGRRGGEIGKCLSVKLSYCCSISMARDSCATPHRADL